MKKIKVIHLTSAHSRYDIRIFAKMCSSLAAFGYDVNLVVADGKGYEEKNNVKIYDVGKPFKRIERMIKSSLLVYKMALFLNGDIYHIHDPELLPYAYLLKCKGKKVIFDSHEDTPKQILTKPYLNKRLLIPISFIYEKFEKYICSKLDYIVTATSFIKDIFIKYNINTQVINNYPILGELECTKKTNKKNQICYVGGLMPIRGIYELVESMRYVNNNVSLAFAGNFFEGINEKELYNRISKEKLVLKGFLNRAQVSELLSSSLAGVVTFLPFSNHINAQPNKMFEYMSAGLPVIGSDFPLWKEIIEDNHCGICVNPMNPKEIAEAIDYLYEHKDEAEQMGLNGKKSVYKKYNWDIEKKKLLNIYEKLLK